MGLQHQFAVRRGGRSSPDALFLQFLDGGGGMQRAVAAGLPLQIFCRARRESTSITRMVSTSMPSPSHAVIYRRTAMSALVSASSQCFTGSASVWLCSSVRTAALSR